MDHLCMDEEQLQRAREAIDLLVGISRGESGTCTAQSPSTSGGAYAVGQSSLSRGGSVLESNEGVASTSRGTRRNESREGGRWERFDKAYRDAIASIRGTRHHRENAEVARIFKRKSGTNLANLQKKSKPSSWTHKFLCLAGTEDNRVPTTTMSRELLTLGGLGEKKIHIPDVDCTTEEFNDLIISTFPKLRDGGGFELLRCIPSTRDLELIPSPTCHSPRLLRSRIGTGKVYIRPIQADINVEDVLEDQLPEVTEVCLKCQKRIPFNNLRSHITLCNGRDEELEYGTTEDSPNSSPGLSPILSPVPSPVTQSPVLSQCDDVALTEETLVDYAIQLNSASNFDIVDVSSDKKFFESLSDIAQHLSKLTVADGEIFFLAVRRSDVLSSALCGIDRKAFSPQKILQINFLGEEAEDGGGPRREFFRLLANEVRSSMCVGRNGSYVFRHDTTGLQTNRFEKLGQLMVMSLAQDGSGFPFFADCLYEYICGEEILNVNINIDAVADSDVYMLLDKIERASDDESFKQVLCDASDVLINAGYTKPLLSLKLADKIEIVKVITLQFTLLQCLAEIEQLKKGLSSLNFLEILRNNRDVLAPFFTSRGIQKLTADSIQDLFKHIVFSEAGTNDRAKEETTYMFFVRLLNECEDPSDPNHLILEEVLIFFSGSEQIPPLGFAVAPSLSFNDCNEYPSASTCALSLTLPTKHHNSYSCFKDKMTFGMKHHGGFGLV